MTLVGSTNLHGMWTSRIRLCWDALDQIDLVKYSFSPMILRQACKCWVPQKPSSFKVLQAAWCVGWSCLALMKNPKRCDQHLSFPARTLSRIGMAWLPVWPPQTYSFHIFSFAWLPQETNGRERWGLLCTIPQPIHIECVTNNMCWDATLDKIDLVHHSFSMMILRRVGKCKCPVHEGLHDLVDVQPLQTL